MAGQIILPRQLPPATEVFPDAQLVVDTGTAVERATPQQVVDAATILAVDVDMAGGGSVESAVTAAAADASEARGVTDAMTPFGRSLTDDADAAAARQTLDLQKQSGSYDATINRVAVVGSNGIFGIGGIATPLSNAEVVDNSIVPGWYHITASTVGIPPGLAWGFLMHSRRAPGGGEVQTLIVQQPDQMAGTIFTRARGSGAWQPWIVGGLSDFFDTRTAAAQRTFPNEQREITITGARHRQVADTDLRGPNLLRNSNFQGSEPWQVGGGWALTTGAATATSTVGNIIHPVGLTQGSTYEVTFTISSITGGGLRVYMPGATNVFGATRSSAGTYTEILTAPASAFGLGVNGVSSASGVVTNVEIRLVSQSGQTITGTGVLRKRWENAEEVITPSMFSNIREMFNFTKGQIQIPAGDYPITVPLQTRPGAHIRVEEGAVFRLAANFNPMRSEVALVTLGEGTVLDNFKLVIPAGITTGPVLQMLGGCDVGSVDISSVNQIVMGTYSSPTDPRIAAVQLRGAGNTVARVQTDNLNRGLSIFEADGSIVEWLTADRAERGFSVTWSKDCRINGGWHKGDPNHTYDPADQGWYAMLASGVENLYVTDFISYDAGGHGFRVAGGGTLADYGAKPSNGVYLTRCKAYRPNLSAFKSQPANGNVNRGIYLTDVYAEDVSRTGTTDANSCFIRMVDTEGIYVNGAVNRRISTTRRSGYNAIRLEGCDRFYMNDVVSGPVTDSGLLIATDGASQATDFRDISNGNVQLRVSGAQGAAVRIVPGDNARNIGGLRIEIDANDTAGSPLSVDARPNGTSPFSTRPSRTIVKGDAFVNGAANSIAASVAADANFINRVVTS